MNAFDLPCGYPTDWFVSPPDPDLICGICLEVLKDPKQCQNGHIYCCSCVSTELKTREQCPTCKCCLKLSALSSNLLARNMVDQLKTKCDCEIVPNFCPWTGPLCQRQNHKTKDCQFIPVACPLYKSGLCLSCSGKTTKGHLDEHMDDNERLFLFKQLIDDDTIDMIEGWTELSFPVASEYKLYTGEVISTEDGADDLKDLGGMRHGDGLMIFSGLDESDRACFCGEWRFGESVGLGVLTWFSGDVYFGQFQAGFVMHGLGTFKHAVGGKYRGGFVNGVLCGHGVKKNADGSKFDGLFKDGLMHGCGVLTCKDGRVISGEWEADQLVGSHTVTFPDGSVYSSGPTSGQGVFKRADGNVFTGEWNGRHFVWNVTVQYKSGGSYVGAINEQFQKHGVGTSTHTNQGEGGKSYSGSWVHDKKQGRGVMTYLSGDIYDGEWLADKPQGQGRMVCANGNIKEGTFLNGKLHGLGKSIELNPYNRYEGSWQYGLLHGHGMWCGENNHLRYAGRWKFSQRCGHGTMNFTNGDVYHGEWRDDFMCGQGRRTFSNGASYVGGMLHDQASGTGEMKYANDNVYSGGWLAGQRHGRGALTEGRGVRYVGGWMCGDRGGEGVQTYQNGDKYGGSWVDNKRDGLGVVMYANGDQYEGYFKDGLRCGYGRFIHCNGAVFGGQWVSDREHGQGRLSHADGELIAEGEWLNGEFVSPPTKQEDDWGETSGSSAAEEQSQGNDASRRQESGVGWAISLRQQVRQSSRSHTDLHAHNSFRGRK